MDESTPASTTDPGGRARGRVTWPDLERALQARPGWRRVGKEWRGPCPVTGEGTRGAWFQPGRTAAVVGGCHKCGASFEAHLSAVTGATARDVAPHATNARPATRRPPSDLPARLWRASAAPDGTPGARYLEQRGVWPAGERLPAAVRWLPGDVAGRVGVTPPLPGGAVGCVVYLFQAPGSADVHALQLEAVDTAGERVKFYPRRPEDDQAKRPSVSGCTFDSGRRVFRAAGDPDRAIHVCEGPLDALALVHLERLGLVELDGGAVHGTSGEALFRAGACPGRGPVTVWAQDDKAGVLAAARLARELERRQRPWVIRRPAEGLTGLDWADVAREEQAEREALRDA